MPKRIPEESKRPAISLVLDPLDEYPSPTTARESVATRLGFGTESLRRWVRQPQVDAGERAELSPSDSERILQLERENRELREANATLLHAAVFLAGNSIPNVADPRVHRESARQGLLGRVDLPGLAGWGKPTPDRIAQRNGYRHRNLDTRVGSIDVAVPKPLAETSTLRDLTVRSF